MSFKKITELDEFKKEFKKLKKKFLSLDSDLKTFISAQLVLYHKMDIDNGGIVEIPGLGFDEPKIYKAKKFACKYLKGRGGRSGIRVIYAHYPDEDRIELIEIYFKGEKENEDKKRIKKYYG